MTNKKTSQFVVCINNDGYLSSLERRKIYKVLPDPEANNQQMIRIFDDSGDDYLFPISYFLSITLPQNIVDALALGI